MALTANAVPYSGATDNVNLGAYYLSARGIVAGFSASNPNVAARLTNYWFPRDADIGTGWMFDYQDEFAVRYKKGAAVSVSPSPSFGTGNNRWSIIRLTFNTTVARLLGRSSLRSTRVAILWWTAGMVPTPWA